MTKFMAFYSAVELMQIDINPNMGSTMLHIQRGYSTLTNRYCLNKPVITNQ